MAVNALYQKQGVYRYTFGVNWRALLTILIVVPVNLPGLINAIDAGVYIGNYAYFCKHSRSRQDHGGGALTISVIDKASWMTAVAMATGVYLALSFIAPARETFVDDDEYTGDGVPYGDIPKAVQSREAMSETGV